MPHISVKMFSGRTDAEKQDLADRLTRAVMDALGHGEDAVSVAIEEVEQSQWMDKIYTPEIEEAEARLWKRPGYGPLAG